MGEEEKAYRYLLVSTSFVEKIIIFSLNSLDIFVKTFWWVFSLDVIPSPDHRSPSCGNHSADDRVSQVILSPEHRSPSCGNHSADDCGFTGYSVP